MYSVFCHIQYIHGRKFIKILNRLTSDEETKRYLFNLLLAISVHERIMKSFVECGSHVVIVKRTTA